MKALTLKLKNMFKSKPRLSREEEYISQATSLEDIERRQRDLMNGRAPWQVKAGYYL